MSAIDSTATAKRSMDLVINELRECLNDCGAVESLLYLSLIEQAAELRGHIAALAEAARQDSAG